MIIETSAIWRPGSALSLLGKMREDRTYYAVANATARAFRGEAVKYAESGKSFTQIKPVGRFVKWQFAGGGAMVRTRARYLVWMEEGTASHRIYLRSHQDEGAFIGLSRYGRVYSKYNYIKGRNVGDDEMATALAFSVGGKMRYGRPYVNHPGTKEKRFFFTELAARQAIMLKAARETLEIRLLAKS